MLVLITGNFYRVYLVTDEFFYFINQFGDAPLLFVDVDRFWCFKTNVSKLFVKFGTTLCKRLAHMLDDIPNHRMVFVYLKQGFYKFGNRIIVVFVDICKDFTNFQCFFY